MQSKLLLIATLSLTLACSEEKAAEGATLMECRDGEDNDSNGDIDCDDAGCADQDICAGDTGSGDGGGSSDGGSSDGGSSGEGWGAVVINEFMASNATTIADETDAYPDWIEIYNGSSEAIDLQDWTISDNLDEPDKNDLSGLSIEAGGYLVLFADGDVEDGERHLDFSLDADGEALILSDPNGGVRTQLEYAAQATDWSAARMPDGTGSWEVTDAPTPGSSNGQ